MAGLLSITEPTENTPSNDTGAAAPRPHSRDEIAQLFELPLMDLLLQAQTIHRQHFTAINAKDCSASDKLSRPVDRRT